MLPEISLRLLLVLACLLTAILGTPALLLRTGQRIVIHYKPLKMDSLQLAIIQATGQQE